MISAFARAAQVLGDTAIWTRDPRGRVRQAKALRRKRRNAGRSYRGGPADIAGFAEDYAFYIQGLLDLYEASFDVKWLRLAEQLQATQDRLFLGRQATAATSPSTGDDPSILLRMKEDNDNAEPAPSSIAALNLLRLAQIRDAKALRVARAERQSPLSTRPEPFPERDAADAGRARFQPDETEDRSSSPGNPDATTRASCSKKCTGIICRTRSCSWLTAARARNFSPRNWRK